MTWALSYVVPASNGQDSLSAFMILILSLPPPSINCHGVVSESTPRSPPSSSSHQQDAAGEASSPSDQENRQYDRNHAGSTRRRTRRAVRSKSRPNYWSPRHGGCTNTPPRHSGPNYHRQSKKSVATWSRAATSRSLPPHVRPLQTPPRCRPRHLHVQVGRGTHREQIIYHFPSEYLYIYIYFLNYWFDVTCRGDTAFCSSECREKQIKQDERREVYGAAGSKKKDERHAPSSTAAGRGSRKGQDGGGRLWEGPQTVGQYFH